MLSKGCGANLFLFDCFGAIQAVHRYQLYIKSPLSLENLLKFQRFFLVSAKAAYKTKFRLPHINQSLFNPQTVLH
jgi:hypothetical protein